MYTPRDKIDKHDPMDRPDVSYKLEALYTDRSRRRASSLTAAVLFCFSRSPCPITSRPVPPSLLALSLLRIRRIARSPVTSVLILANSRLRPVGSLDIPAENAVVSTRLSCAFATSGGESSYNRRRLSGRMLRVWSTGGTGRRTGCRALGMLCVWATMSINRASSRIHQKKPAGPGGWRGG